jgi:hypothetical protein
MSLPPVDYGEELDPISLERQRRRYASRAIGYLVLLNGVAALILLASLSRWAKHIPEPLLLVDAMLVFGAGAAIALGSTFFAYVRRTVRLQAPERVPLRVGLWWLSVIAAILAAACFLIGLNMAGRASLPDRAAMPSGAKFGADKDGKKQSRTKREGRDEGKRDKGDKDEKSETQQEEERPQEPSSKADQKSSTETAPAGPQPLTRTACDEAGRSWNDSTHTCD